MKKDSRTRLFEVMGRLDKTFKPRLNEEFEQANPVAFAQPMGGEEVPEKEELTVEEKYEELKSKVEELYAMIHGEESEEEPEGEESVEEPEEEGLTERKKWNFEKKKGEKDDDSEEHEENETPDEEKKEHEKGGYEFGKKEQNESKPKIPVNNIAKVGK